MYLCNSRSFLLGVVKKKEESNTKKKENDKKICTKKSKIIS
jgi:hypothetical protein